MARLTAAVFAVVFLFAGTAGTAVAGSKEMKAKADIKDAKGKTIGTARLTEVKGGVQVALKVTGLTPGKHGLHFHETGTCNPPDFKSAGAHFNPFHTHHGMNNPKGKHAGDLPNLEVKQDGSAEVTVVAQGTTLRKGQASLLKDGGTALVIHAGPDDNVTDPAGNAGDRIACGVVVKD